MLNKSMKLLGIHHRLHQLAVPLLHLDPRLSGSSGGLLFPIIVWARPFHLPLWHSFLFSPQTGRFGQLSRKMAGWPTNGSQGSNFSTWGVQEYFNIIWTRGPILCDRSHDHQWYWVRTRGGEWWSASVPCTCILFLITFPHSLLWLWGLGTEL